MMVRERGGESSNLTAPSENVPCVDFELGTVGTQEAERDRRGQGEKDWKGRLSELGSGGQALGWGSR